MQYEYTPEDVQRFWNKVDQSSGPDACWPWTASRNPKGYGYKGWAGRIHLSHRVAWMIAYGEIPSGMFVCHKCDNPSCCNPSHLFLGSNQDNVNDKMKKGRGADLRGEKNGHHTLSDDQVAEIRSRYTPWKHGGDNSETLSKEFGVSASYILRIAHGDFRS